MSQQQMAQLQRKTWELSGSVSGLSIREVLAQGHCKDPLKAAHHAAEDTAADTACSLPSRDQSQSPDGPPPPDAWLLPSGARDQPHPRPSETHSDAAFWAEAQCRHPKLSGISDQRAGHFADDPQHSGGDSGNSRSATALSHAENTEPDQTYGAGRADEAAAAVQDTGERSHEEDVGGAPSVLRAHSWFLGLGANSSDTAVCMQDQALGRKAMKARLAGGGCRDEGSGNSAPVIRASQQLAAQTAPSTITVSARSLLFGICHGPGSATTRTSIHSSSTSQVDAGTAPPNAVMRELTSRARQRRLVVATEAAPAAAGLSPRQAAAMLHHRACLGRSSNTLICGGRLTPSATPDASTAPWEDADGLFGGEQPLRQAAAIRAPPGVAPPLQLERLGPKTLLVALRLSLQAASRSRRAATVSGAADVTNAAVCSRPSDASASITRASKEPLVSPVQPASAGDTDRHPLLRQCCVLQAAAADRAVALMCAAMEAAERALEAERMHGSILAFQEKVLLSSAPVSSDGGKFSAHGLHRNDDGGSFHDGCTATTPKLHFQSNGRLKAMLAACDEAEMQQQQKEEGRQQEEAAVPNSRTMIGSSCRADHGGGPLAPASVVLVGPQQCNLGGGDGHSSSRRGRRNAGIKLHSNALFQQDVGPAATAESDTAASRDDVPDGHRRASPQPSAFHEGCCLSAKAAKQPTAEAVCAAVEAQLRGVRQRNRLRRMSSEASCCAAPLPSWEDHATDGSRGEENRTVAAAFAAAAVHPFTGDVTAVAAGHPGSMYHHTNGLDGRRPSKQQQQLSAASDGTVGEAAHIRAQFVQLVQACRHSAVMTME